jgi:imidazoleglycerol-phosphate dehydratase/histidinol-phosphatase
MKKVLFIDRDGTIIIEPPNEQVDSLEKLEFVPGAIVSLNRIASELNFELVMVSNQDGLGTDSFPENTFWPVQNKMLKTLANEGIIFDDILIDRSFPHENLATRKPGTAMLTKYMNGKYDLKNSFVIGDRITDVQLAENLGTKAIFIAEETDIAANLVTTSWQEIYRYLRSADRVCETRRKTNETDVHVRLQIDGQGNADISTGIGFLDHMLELFARHSSFDLHISVQGDLHVDKHHTIEDTAITLGETLSKALGNKKGIERYGFLLPMDESVAQVAIDLSGRSELVWQAEFKRERIGEMPTEMFCHFFKSFADQARCNLYIKAEGKNEHHKIEAIFKAVARALKMAVRKDPQNRQVPSTKGVL